MEDIMTNNIKLCLALLASLFAYQTQASDPKTDISSIYERTQKLASGLRSLDARSNELDKGIQRLGRNIRILRVATHVVGGGIVIGMAGTIGYMGYLAYQLDKDLNLTKNQLNEMAKPENLEKLKEMNTRLQEQANARRQEANGWNNVVKLNAKKECKGCDLRHTPMDLIYNGLTGADLEGATNAHLAKYKKCSKLRFWEKDKANMSNEDAIQSLTAGYTICE
jgi:hypothetical protein